jgi:hypothetical protein
MSEARRVGIMAERKSRDQKRKAKLADRSRKQAKNTPLEFEGKTYQKPEWVQHVYRTELGVYLVLQMSGKRLTNPQVEAAFVWLIEHLRGGGPALLPEDTPDVPFEAGRETDCVVWSIRRQWGELFAEAGPVATEHLVGILRTLLYSIKAHAWNTGPNRGYVEFLDGFLGRGIVPRIQGPAFR